MSELSTTSYAILGLLSLRPWSAYDLSKQMKRWALIWPRAERAVYNEPKRLVEHRLATAEMAMNGKQRRTVYTITPAGRRALRRWLRQPSAPPQFESEALVRALFAPSGSKDDLLAAIGSLGDYAQTLRALGEEAGHQYLAGDVPFPERMHVIALVLQFNMEYVALLERWSAWAQEQVQGWADTTSPDVFPGAMSAVIRALLNTEDEDPVRRSRGQAKRSTSLPSSS
ncbi:MAG TPA: PadR family transcriptional regulator [Acidimicrobiia bacterium]|nr:PadR family transcriptional regulator [Acidimicrobiia bacterium]